MHIENILVETDRLLYVVLLAVVNLVVAVIPQANIWIAFINYLL